MGDKRTLRRDGVLYDSVLGCPSTHGPWGWSCGWGCRRIWILEATAAWVISGVGMDFSTRELISLQYEKGARLMGAVRGSEPGEETAHRPSLPHPCTSCQLLVPEEGARARASTMSLDRLLGGEC